MAILLSSLAMLALAGDAAPAPEIPVTGRVFDAQGKPAAKVLVELVPFPSGAEAKKLQLLGKAAPGPLKQTVTDAKGRFELTASEVGMYEVVVRAPDAVPAAAPLFPLLGATVLPSLRLEPSEKLRVRVLGSDGQPLAGVAVAASPNGAPNRAASLWRPHRRLGMTDPAGTVYFPRRRGEILDLAASAAPVGELRAARIASSTVDLRASAICPWRIVVRDASGQPVAEALVSGAVLTLGTTDIAGLLTVTGPCKSGLRIGVSTADGRRAVVSIPAAQATPDPVAVVLQPPDRYSGRVLDVETRAPLAGALVWADDDPAGFVRADARGAFTLTRTPQSTGSSVQIRAAAAAHLPGVQKVAAGKSVPTFALQPTALLSGNVVDTNGKAVADAEIRVEQTNAEVFPRYGAKPEGLPTRTVSRANGAFRIEVLPRRAYTLHAWREGFAPSALDVPEKPGPAATRSGLRIVLSAGVTAFGKVVDGGSSRPVSGSELHLAPVRSTSLPSFLRNMDRDSDAEESEELQAYSDGEGTFRFEHLAPGRFDLTAKADGFAPRNQRGLSIESIDRPTDLGTLRLEKGIVVEGSVADRGGKPVAGATLIVLPPSASGIRAADRTGLGTSSLAEASSDRNGRFTLTGLAGGDTVDITARHQGYVPATVSRLELPPSEPLQLVLEPAARVSGHVVSDRGGPVGGAVVTARPVDAALPAGLSGRVVTADASGEFALDDLAAGKTAIGAVARGFTAGDPLQLDLTAGRSIDDVRITLGSGATIEGTVLTPTGRPATAARVSLRQTMTPDRMIAIEVAGAARTDGDGRYRLEGVPAGAQSVSADQEGFQRTIRDLEVHPGENHLDLRLGEGYGVTGRVLDAGGRGLGGVAVGLYSAIPGIVRDDTSEPDGAFRFSGLDPGRYALSATKEGYSSARQEVQLSDRAVDGVELRLQPGGGAIVGRLLGLAPGEMAQVQVNALERPLHSSDGMREGHANVAGGYRIEGVFAGDWSVTARLANGRQVRKAVTIAEGAREVQLDLEFGQGASLSGTVRRRGQPVSEAAVQASGTSSDSFGSAVTGGDGAFHIEGLTAGEHRVTAVQAQSGVRAERVVSVAGNQRLDLDLPTARAGGRVVDAAGGTALAGVTVTGELVAASAPDSLAPRTTSGADGSFVLPNLGAGSYRIRGEKEGYARGELRVELSGDDASLDSLRLALDREQGLILDVTSTLGPPPSRIGVALVDGAGQIVLSQTVSPGENGRTRIAGAPNGSFRLLAGADAMATTSLAVQVPGPPVGTLLRRAARVTVDVPDLVGRNAVATLLVAGGDGQPFRSLSRGSVQQAWPLINGRTKVDGLPAGNWTLLVTGPNAQRWQGSVTVSEGQEAQASLR
jgi:protocatechuate 3,4-dioxygenase beta subunit